MDFGTLTYVILATIGILFLAALVFVGVGHKGWHAGTITAAVLVILSSLCFLFLTSMLAQQEHNWRVRVNAVKSELRRVRDGLNVSPDGETSPTGECGTETLQNCSIADLISTQERWRRQRDRVNSWRGTWWRHASFTGPSNGDPGTLEITTSETPTLNAGAPVYVFDEATEEQLGDYVGAFQVISVDGSSLEIIPLLPPDDNDNSRWAQPHDDVLVLESLPVDRWMAFYLTDEESKDPAWPAIMQRANDEVTAGVADFEQMEIDLGDLTVNGTLLLDADNFEVGRTFDDLRNASKPPPGVEWAEVTFDDFGAEETKNFTWPDGTVTEFKSREVLPAFPANQVGLLLEQMRDQEADLSYVWVIPPGLYWAEVLFNEAYTHDIEGQLEPLKFEAGVTAILELEFAERKALELGQEKMTISRRFFRRPLTDARTEMLGAEAIAIPVGNEAPEPVFENVRSLGMYRIRQELQQTLDNSVARTEELEAAVQVANDQHVTLVQKQKDLELDKGNWEKDLKAADRIEASVKDRYEAIEAELQATEEAIVLLGQQLRQMTASVTAEIDRRTPPPDLLEAPPAAGASVQ